jgi:hypothetical protein
MDNEAAGRRMAMKQISVGPAIIAFITGIIAAWFWYESAKVDPKTGWTPPSGDATKDDKALLANFNAVYVWIFAIKDALRESGRLNKWAAGWTAASVFFGAASSLARSLAA